MLLSEAAELVETMQAWENFRNTTGVARGAN